MGKPGKGNEVNKPQKNNYAPGGYISIEAIEKAIREEIIEDCIVDTVQRVWGKLAAEMVVRGWMIEAMLGRIGMGQGGSNP